MVADGLYALQGHSGRACKHFHSMAAMKQILDEADSSLQSSDFRTKTLRSLPVFQHGLSACSRVHAPQDAAESQSRLDLKNTNCQFHRKEKKRLHLLANEREAKYDTRLPRSHFNKICTRQVD